MGKIYEVAVEMSTGAMMYSYIPSFIKIGAGIQNFIDGIQRYRPDGDCTSLLSKNRLQFLTYRHTEKESFLLFF
jgi:hypothetical protein